MVDGAKVPGEVGEPNSAAALRASCATEVKESEVVVIARTPKSENCGVGPWLVGHERHVKLGLVKGERSFEFGDEPCGVVETNQ